MTLCGNAKLNLYLDITGRRNDGYHLLETVMQSIDLCDIITVKLADGVDGISVQTSNPLIPSGRRNICTKAAEMFFSAAGKKMPVEIYIDKRIPHAAGLGGGSADAAAVLTALNVMLGNPMGENELIKLAARVGADVPFCLCGGIKACFGIGDELSDMSPFPEVFYLVIMPDFYCDTHGAYVEYDDAPLPRYCGMSKFIKSGEGFPKRMYNVFKQLYDNESINAIVNRLSALGAEGANLSGSGSAVFGVFKDEKTAREAAAEFPKYFTAVCKPVNKGIITVDSDTIN